jgi:hypothetical protein
MSSFISLRLQFDFKIDYRHKHSGWTSKNIRDIFTLHKQLLTAAATDRSNKGLAF